EFILREQMAYDLELAMDEREAPLFCLDTRQNIALGWTSFLGQDAANKHVLIQVRQ
ncbi:TPA: type VI secretion system baseplate subunit TssG, partial [Vibrio cholerae]|nr:type VI secretion system baseplate subunit TssG [Vibrio cholerae]